MNTVWPEHVQGILTLYLGRKLRFDDIFFEQYKKSFHLNQSVGLETLETGCGLGALLRSCINGIPMRISLHSTGTAILYRLQKKTSWELILAESLFLLKINIFPAETYFIAGNEYENSTFIRQNQSQPHRYPSELLAFLFLTYYICSFPLSEGAAGDFVPVRAAAVATRTDKAFSSQSGSSLKSS